MSDFYGDPDRGLAYGCLISAGMWVLIVVVVLSVVAVLT